MNRYQVAFIVTVETDGVDERDAVCRAEVELVTAINNADEAPWYTESEMGLSSIRGVMCKEVE